MEHQYLSFNNKPALTFISDILTLIRYIYSIWIFLIRLTTVDPFQNIQLLWQKRPILLHSRTAGWTQTMVMYPFLRRSSSYSCHRDLAIGWLFHCEYNQYLPRLHNYITLCSGTDSLRDADYVLKWINYHTNYLSPVVEYNFIGQI